MILPSSFYLRGDVVQIARDLIGKQLFSSIGGELTGGIITETEAYRAPDDRACHAYDNRRTPRTEVMFQEGGIAYVYLCYGMHNLLNVVTAEQGCAHAVLIRALAPTHGLEAMLRRRKKEPLAHGPGALCQALGITREHNGHSLKDRPLWIEKGMPFTGNILATPRIGVDYAGEDAKRLWRFVLEKVDKKK